MDLIKTWIVVVWLTGMPAIAILIYLFMHPDKFEHWMAIFYKLLYGLTSVYPRIRRRFARHVVASGIQDSVNAICERINKEAPDVLPHALKIEWVKSVTPESFLDKGRVIVRLKHYSNQDRNIVDSTLWYLRRGLLPGSRRCLDGTLHTGCVFKIASKVFDAKRDTGAYDYFVDNELRPRTAADASLKADLQMLEDLDSVGFFTQVFLTEVKQIGERLLGTTPTDAAQQEVRNFAEFLQRIATKKEAEHVPLAFKRSRIRVAVILVAKRETIQMYGIAPYVNRVRGRVREGYDSIYLGGWGKFFVGKVLDIKKQVAPEDITVLRRYDPTIGQEGKGILLVCQSNLSYLARQRQLQDEVKKALVQIVPKVASGQVEIVGIARREGAGMKIAVRSAVGESSRLAKGACIGQNSERVRALKVRFPDEFIGIVGWSDDPKEFLLEALAPLQPSRIESVEILEEDMIAVIRVSSDEALQKALGPDHNNAKLASELTGWFISLEGPTEVHVLPSSEDELRDILVACVPELRDEEIEIVRVARIRGVGSRVVVRWKKYRQTRRTMASQVCRGPDYEHARQIKDRITGEWLYFHEWCEDAKEQIVECLYPVKRNDVSGIDLDEASNTAIVTLADPRGLSQSSWDDYKLALSQRVTGWRIEIETSSSPEPLER